MDIGMLWLDDSTRSVDEKVKRAVAFYTEKYGRQPTLCMVNPTTTESEGTMAGVQVRPARSVLPHHFLVGLEDERPNGKTAPASPRPGLTAAKGKGERGDGPEGGRGGEGGQAAEAPQTGDARRG